VESLTWQLPLLVTPIVGLLLISTSTRHAQIHNEIHRLLQSKYEIPQQTTRRLRMRVQLFRNALVALYLSAALFALGSLAGLILTLTIGRADSVIVIFSTAGIISFLYASLQLIRESSLSLEIFNTHLDQIEVHDQDDLARE